MLFNGIALSTEQQAMYNSNLNNVNTMPMELGYNRLAEYTHEYQRTKGWMPWSCDEVCTMNYNDMKLAQKEYDSGMYTCVVCNVIYIYICSVL